MKLEYWILGLLKINPRTGYDLKKFLDAEGRFGRARAPLSQIYNTLKRMAENDWVTFEEVAREGKPDVKIYHNTAAGEQVFLDYLHSPIKPPFRFTESDLRYRVAFAFLVEPDVIIDHIQTELEHRLEQIAKFRGRDRTVQSTSLTESEIAYAQELYELLHLSGVREIDLYVESLQEMLAYFENKKREQSEKVLAVTK